MQQTVSVKVEPDPRPVLAREVFFETRRLLLWTLLALPVALFLIAGTWALATVGWLPMVLAVGGLCALSVFALLRLHREPALPQGANASLAAADREARAIVERYCAQVAGRDPGTFAQPKVLAEDASALANELARHYEPGASDALEGRTVRELAAVLSLAFEQLERRVDQLVPGSHMLTIRQWRALARAPRFVAKAGRNVSVLAGALGIGRRNTPPAIETDAAPATAPRAKVQGGVLATLHATFLREVGFYLVEMSSGRLRGGSSRYRAEHGTAVPQEEPGREGWRGVLNQIGNVHASWRRRSS